MPGHQVPGTAATVVPDHPVTLVVCRYHGLNQTQSAGALVSAARFEPDWVAAALNHASAIQTQPARSCPLDTGEVLWLLFAYSNGSRLMVAASTSGCLYTTNGDRTVITPIQTLAQLEAVVGHDVP